LSKELAKINSGNGREEIFPEHSFIATCLRVGMCISDLKLLTYVDVMKILLSFIPSKNNQKYATQRDIDKLLG